MADMPLPSSGRVGASWPSGGSVTPSMGTFDVTLSGSDFDQTTEGGGLDLTFDPHVVQVVSVHVDGKVWEFFAQDGAIDNEKGQVDGILFASFVGRKGAFAIATLTLRAVQAGKADFRLTESAKNPFASSGRRLTVQLD